MSEDSFWVQLRNITGIDAVESKKISNQVRKWYLEDMAYVQESENFGSTDQTKDLSSTTPYHQQMSQQMMETQKHIQTTSMGMLSIPSMGTIEINDEDTLTIARSYLSVLEKKIKERKTLDSASNPETPTN